MGGEVEACEECSRNCLLIHKKRNPSLIVSSFFKVMFGKHFSSVVMLPPRFVKLTSLVAQETYLEDSCGRKWDAILSDIDGSLAIQRGWNNFFVDHGIQAGEFVVFHYIIGSHFLVQIYGTHGCEKLSLLEENTYPNKRAKSTNYSISTNACPIPELEVIDCERQDELNDVQELVVVKRDASNKAKTTESLNIVPLSDFVDDAHFLINDQEHLPREDDRDHLFDLSIFEMPQNSQVCALQKAEIRTASNSCITKKRYSPEAITLSKNQEVFMSKKEYNPSSTCPRVGTPLSSNTPLRAVGMSSNSEFLATPGGRRTLVVKQDPKVQTPDFISRERANISPGINQQKVLSSNMPYKSALEVQNPGLSAPSDYCQPPGVKVEMVKQESQELSQNLSDNVNLDQTDGGNLNENLYCAKNDDSKVGITAKLEPVDLCDPSSPAMAKITCSVLSDSEPFLELPECLPMKAVAKFQSISVLLHDPLRRLWPVLYHHKFGVKVLANGWKAFRDANNIQPGDECTFTVESAEESIFLVEILRGKTP